MPQDGLAIHENLDDRARKPHLERDPAADRHLARHVLDRLEVVAVSSQQQPLASRVQRDLVADEPIGADAGLVHPDDQAGVHPVAVGEHQLDADRAILEGRPVADQLRPIAGTNADRVVDDQPASPEGLESRDGRRRRRLLKALAEDHLAVEAAVDLVVHVLDAGTGQVTRHPPDHPAGVDLDLLAAKVAGGREDRRQDHDGREQRRFRFIDSP